eukprot:scaffold15137_cov124-Skeletonema_marinoi.AAC.1
MMHHHPAMIAIIVLPQRAVSGGTSTWTLQPVALWLRIALGGKEEEDQGGSLSLSDRRPDRYPQKLILSGYSDGSTVSIKVVCPDSMEAKLTGVHLLT